MKKWMMGTLSMVVILAFVAGCGKSSSSEGASASSSPSPVPKISNDPVTIHFLCSGVPTKCNDLLNQAKDAAKLPNVTIESESLTNVDKALSAGWMPDLVNVTPAGLYKAIDAGLTGDMTPMFKKYNYDISVFPKEQLDSIRKYDAKSGLYAVPQSPRNHYNWYGLDYNKDIFDKFAVDYPKDNMTWEQVIELGKRLTRTDGGVKYTGLIIDQPQELIMQRGLNFSDNNGKVTMDDPKWKQIFDILKAVHDATDEPVQSALSVFYNKKTIAMYAGNHVGIITNHDAMKDFNWDIVTYPRFSDMTQPILPPSIGLYSIPPTSKHQDVAFALLKALQNDPALVKGDLDKYEGDIMATKHTAALKDQKTSVYTPERYFNVAVPLFKTKLGEVFNKNLDTNTAIMQLKDQIAVAIEQAKSK